METEGSATSSRYQIPKMDSLNSINPVVLDEKPDT